MSDKTGIEWTDATWNPVTGCAKVSQGCKHCYAEREWPRMTRLVPAYAGRDFTDVRTHEDRLDQPLRWKKPRKVFVNSMSDLFHSDVPDEFIDKVFITMALCPQHTFQVLTKRADRMQDYVTRLNGGRLRNRLIMVDAPNSTLAWPLQNVWLGVSVEDQDAADERIPLLLDTPAAVRWISAEPLLGPVDLTDLCDGVAWPDVPRNYWNEGFDSDDSPPSLRLDALAGEKLQRFGNYSEYCARLDWVVVGGESGPKARPMSIQWARSLRDQCAEAGVPFLFKQWGEWAPAAVRQSETPGQFAYGDYEHEPGHFVNTDRYPRAFTSFGARAIVERVGKKTAGRLLDGVKHDGYPEGGAA
ncbi:DUF5131 family protein [Azonexus caeni]|uniref:DUF5131 family protein n=1 Tax=Azonexus caeni TaxID=266126 RepID=UPI003A8B9ACA